MNPALNPDRTRPPTKEELAEWRAECDRYPEWNLSVRIVRLVNALESARELGMLHVMQAMIDVPVDELGGISFGEGTCTDWETIREEHEEADEDEKETTQYQMICEGVERVRRRLMRAAHEGSKG